jgi:hypothetical protein
MIYGIGLPRTGTSTLSESLRLMQMQGFSYCVITDVLRQDKATSFIVNNSFYNRLEALVEKSGKMNDNNKYIVTTRPDKCWGKSINKFPESVMLPKPSAYLETVKQLIPEEQLLVVDWSAGDEWKPLCKFLGLPVPPFAFPCENC